MTELLPTGWWRCNCQKDCGCGGKVNVLHPPHELTCDKCNADKPAYQEKDIRIPKRRQRTLEESRARRSRPLP